MKIFGFCTHKHKSPVDMEIVDWGRIANVVGEDGKPPIVCTGKYKVYRCLECMCLVWDIK